MKAVPKRVKRGDLIEYHWVDPVGSASSAPESQTLPPCVTSGYFWGTKRDKGFLCLVCWHTVHPGWGDGEEAGSGADVTPLVNIKYIEVIKKSKEITFNG